MKRLNENENNKKPLKTIKLIQNNDLYKEVITNDIVLEIRSLTKGNGCYYDIKSTIYHNMILFIKENFLWLNSKNDQIKLYDGMFMMKNQVKINIEEIKNFKRLFMGIFVITKEKLCNKPLLNLLKWTLIDKDNFNKFKIQDDFYIINNNDIIIYNFIDNPNIKIENETKIKIEEKEPVKNELEIPLFNSIIEITWNFPRSCLRSLIIIYFLFISEILLLKISTHNNEINNEHLNKFDEIKKIFFFFFKSFENDIYYYFYDLIDFSINGNEDFNKINDSKTFLLYTRHIFIYSILLKNPIEIIYGNTKSNNLSYNINSNYLNTWLDYEEFFFKLQCFSIISYDIKTIIDDIIKSNEYQYNLISKSTLLKDYDGKSKYEDFKQIKIITDFTTHDLLIKIPFLFFIKTINFRSKSSFSLFDLINPNKLSNDNNNKWFGYILDCDIYLLPKTFLLNFLPKFQRVISYDSFMIVFLNIPFNNNQYHSYISNRSNIDSLFINDKFFGISGNYSICDIIKYHNNISNDDDGFKMMKKLKNINNHLTKIQYRSKNEFNKQSYDITDKIPNIEDLNFSPCIKNIIDNKIHLKNYDRMTMINWLKLLGYKPEDIKTLFKYENKETLESIKNQYINSIRKNDSQPFSCHAFFNTSWKTAHHENLICPFEKEYRKTRQKNLPQTYSYDEKEIILSKCQKSCGKSNYTSPVTFITNNI